MTGKVGSMYTDINISAATHNKTTITMAATPANNMRNELPPVYTSQHANGLKCPQVKF